MADTINISVPADAPEENIKRVRRSVSLAQRNAEIRRKYPDLRDEYGRDEAFERLRDEYNLSPRQIRRVVYGG